MTPLRYVERFLAMIGLGWLVLSTTLWQTTDFAAPCQALAVSAQEHVPTGAQRIVDACIGSKGEHGIGSLVIDFGLAVTGQSREKIQRQLEQEMNQQLRAAIIGASQLRCTVILAEGMVGRRNGGPAELVGDIADAQIHKCRGDPPRR